MEPNVLDVVVGVSVFERGVQKVVVIDQIMKLLFSATSVPRVTLKGEASPSIEVEPRWTVTPDSNSTTTHLIATAPAVPLRVKVMVVSAVS